MYVYISMLEQQKGVGFSPSIILDTPFCPFERSTSLFILIAYLSCPHDREARVLYVLDNPDPEIHKSYSKLSPLNALPLVTGPSH